MCGQELRRTERSQAGWTNRLTRVTWSAHGRRQTPTHRRLRHGPSRDSPIIQPFTPYPRAGRCPAWPNPMTVVSYPEAVGARPESRNLSGPKLMKYEHACSTHSRLNRRVTAALTIRHGPYTEYPRHPAQQPRKAGSLRIRVPAARRTIRPIAAGTRSGRKGDGHATGQLDGLLLAPRRQRGVHAWTGSTEASDAR
jgi:hypothetical protein